jgi:hypothetical protein
VEVVEVCRRWLADASPSRRGLIRHALRTLIKRGHPGALDLLGFRSGSPVTVENVDVTPSSPVIGDRVSIEATLRNTNGTVQSVLVDLRVHFVKANGSANPKVFKGAELALAPGETWVIRKSVSLAQHTTRTHYPGLHRVEVLVNGDVRGEASFNVKPSNTEW